MFEEQQYGLRFVGISSEQRNEIWDSIKQEGVQLTPYFLHSRNIHHYFFIAREFEFYHVHDKICDYIMSDRLPLLAHAPNSTIYITSPNYWDMNKPSLEQERIFRIFNRKTTKPNDNQAKYLRALLDEKSIPYIYDGKRFYLSENSQEAIQDHWPDRAQLLLDEGILK